MIPKKFFSPIAAAISFGIACSAHADETPATVRQRIAPDYPTAGNGRDGKVTIRFTVDADGRVQDPRVEASDPPGIFDAAGLAAVVKWRYRPRMVDGTAVAQPDMGVVLVIHPPPVPRLRYAYMAPYPSEALKRQLSATVRVRLDITDEGFARHIVVMTHPEDGIFDDTAVESVQRWVFAPLVIGGKPQPFPNAFVDVQFTPPPPMSTDFTAPCYPHAARVWHETGEVKLQLYLDEKGYVQDERVYQSSGFTRLDDAAMECMKHHRFLDKNGNVAHTNGWASMIVRFELQ